jgi:hypothetical protein
MSRSFHLPGPAFWPSGAAKSMMRATAQSARWTGVSARNTCYLKKNTCGTLQACSPAWMCKGSDHRNVRSSMINLSVTAWQSDAYFANTHIVNVTGDAPAVRHGLLPSQLRTAGVLN